MVELSRVGRRELDTVSDRRMTLTFDLLISGSLHAERLPCTVHVRLVSLALKVQVASYSADTQTQSDTADHRTHASVTVGESKFMMLQLMTWFQCAIVACIFACNTLQYLLQRVDCNSCT